jgi:hypothetical protein
MLQVKTHQAVRMGGQPANGQIVPRIGLQSKMLVHWMDF